MVDMKAILLSALAISTLQASFSLGAYFDGENRWSTRMLGAVDVVLAATSSTRCSVILINDGRTSSSDIYTHVSQILAPWGLGVFEEQISGSNMNTTHPQLTDLVQHALQMRRGAWCVTVIVVSDAADFLTEFARQSLQGRLLVWRTRLLVVTPIALIKMRELFSTWYTFSDMNTIVIAERKLKARFKYDIFSHLPYGPDGASFLKIATWTPERGLSMVSQTPFYPEKFNNFHGAQVTVAATTYKPLWVEERWKTSQGEMKIRRFGMDYFLLESIAYNLNFTFKVIPVTFWSEALELTATRQIFATPAYHYILDQRLKRYDFTTGFTSSYIAFCMANPQLEVNWLNLYYPLKDEVWASVVGVLLILSIALHEIQSYSVMRSREKENQGRTTRTLLAILLSQSVLQRHVPSSHSGRVLVAVWLVISLIIGSAYRGSLIASLTLPKYPHRAETIEELVNAVDKVTMMAWGSTFVEFFGKSDYPLFRKLSGLIKPGGSKIDGLNGALTKRQAHLETIHGMQHDIADKFTRRDGTSSLYIGRQSVVYLLAAWPIPHDSPYTPQLDRSIISIVEAGLYEKWTEDMVIRTKLNSIARREEIYKRNEQLKTEVNLEEDLHTPGEARPLTLIQMLVPLLLFLIGLVIGSVTILAEVIISNSPQ